MRNLELGTTIGANDDLGRLWEARWNAWELIHGQLADVWADTRSKEARGHMERFLASPEIVAASTDALLGAVYKHFIDPSDYDALTHVWLTGQGQCDGNKTTLEQLRDLRWSSFKPNWTSMADLLCDRLSCLFVSRTRSREILEHIECMIGPTYSKRSDCSWTS
jgi:hypothetical protein